MYFYLNLNFNCKKVRKLGNLLSCFFAGLVVQEKFAWRCGGFCNQALQFGNRPFDELLFDIPLEVSEKRRRVNQECRAFGMLFQTFVWK